MRRLLGAVIIANILAGALVLRIPSAPSDLAAAAPPRSCDWNSEYERTIRELGEDPRDVVRVAGIARKGQAYLDAHMIGINPSTPCDMVSSVIRHEWAHVQQGRLAGGLAAAWRKYGDRLEIVADCASWLLGSEHTPYRQQRIDDQLPGCTAADLADARELLGFRPPAAPTR
ncbi:hypothetical protein ABZ639_18790 [Saccharomonospora sp. NPDC006951]